MTRREQIIDILKIWDGHVLYGSINKDIADAILALPLDVPGFMESNKEANNYVKNAKEYSPDYGVSLAFLSGTVWMKNEIKNRNK